MMGVLELQDCETLNSDEIEKIEKHQLPDTKLFIGETQN